MSEKAMSPGESELMDDFAYFLRRLPEVVISDREITRRVLMRKGLNRDLAEFFLDEIAKRSKGEVWVAMSILISFLVNADKCQERKTGTVRVI